MSRRLRHPLAFALTLCCAVAFAGQGDLQSLLQQATAAYQAKERPERVVASQRIVDRATADESARWRLLEPLLLRGRLDPTVLAVPV